MKEHKIDFNKGADYWRYDRGANVIPANTREKTTHIIWSEYQSSPISDEQHEKWKAEGAFNKGMAVIAGKVWHNSAKKDLYLILVDLDNRKAIDDFCTRNGVKTPLEELAKKVIIEQHADEPNKAHVIFYATHPFPKKSSDVAKLSDLMKHNEIPAIEVKGAGEHGLLFVSPSVHKNGSHYEIIGTKDPDTIDEMEQHLQDVCKKYGMQYGNANSSNNNILASDDNLIPIKDLFKAGIKIVEGQNRHEALMRVMESLILRNHNILDEGTIRAFAEKWNNEVCKPPLDAKEFNRQWRAALAFIDKINKENAMQRYELEERRRREAIEQELVNSKERENEKKDPIKIGVLARLNEEGANHFGYGQLSSLGQLYKRVRAAYMECRKCGRNKEIVFSHPETRQYFLENFAVGGECWWRFTEDDNDCKGWVKSEPKWVNALDIEVSDTSSLQDIDRIKCILLGDDTNDVGIGENVIIFGQVFMEGSKGGATFPVSYLQSIKYEGREEEELTKLEIEGIRRFREKFADDEEYIKKLVELTACNVIGLEDIKEGILYMVARAKPDKPNKRERVHGVIISLPGMAKTALLNYTTELMDRSTFETAQLSTRLSLIAIVENTGEMKILRLGPVSASMLACVDEFNRMSGSDQEKFFGVMEEGRTTTVKFGRKVKITAPVTILASINPPEGSDYDSQGRIDLQSMNIIAPILSRFDLKFYIPTLKDEEEIRKQVNAKADLETRMHGAPNYSRFLKKMMVYIKQNFANPTVTPEALSVISEAYLQLKKENSGLSLRVFNLLVNLTQARAMLLQSKKADSEIAKTVVKYYSKTIKAYQIGTDSIEPRDPIEVAIEECKNFLCEQFGQDTFEFTESDLLKKICESNRQVDRYVKSGVAKNNYFDKSNNKKARYILERLRIRYQEIVVINKRPVTLKWMPKFEGPESLTEAHSDHNDHNDTSGEEGWGSNENVSSSTMTTSTIQGTYEENKKSRGMSLQKQSKASEGSESANSSASFECEYSCYVCIKNNRPRFETNSKSEYDKHYCMRHPRKPAYPGKADLKLYGWKSQGKPWEV